MAPNSKPWLSHDFCGVEIRGALLRACGSRSFPRLQSGVSPGRPHLQAPLGQEPFPCHLLYWWQTSGPCGASLLSISQNGTWLPSEQELGAGGHHFCNFIRKCPPITFCQKQITRHSPYSKGEVYTKGWIPRSGDHQGHLRGPLPERRLGSNAQGERLALAVSCDCPSLVPGKKEAFVGAQLIGRWLWGCRR